MAKRKIIIAPDPRLRAICSEVSTVDEDTARLMSDMLETMYSAPGIGLAAPQLGVKKRIIVVDAARGEEELRPYKMANPEILWSSSEEKAHEEGCLSLPTYYENVVRSDQVRVRYTDEYNAVQELEADGLLSVVVQHEIDHLDGKLFVDHISSLKRAMILKKLRKTKKQMATEQD